VGEVRKRGGVYWIRYYRDGRRIEESARTEKYTEAENLLKQREGDVARGVPHSAKIGRLRFGDASKDLLTDYEINGKRSHDNLKTTIIEGALEPWFRGRRMASLTTADIRAYVADRQKKGYANGTINRELSALKRMFTLAIQAGKLLQRPHIPMLVERNVRKGFFEREQFDAVRNRLAPMYQGVVTLAYYTGWRINSEILTLEWRQIDRAATVIRLEPGTTKNREGRVFLCADLPEVVAAIEGLWARHEVLGHRARCRRSSSADATVSAW
jgi:integrase